RAGQKQNPVPRDGAPCTSPRYIPLHQGTEQLPDKLHHPLVHTDAGACTSPRPISRVNHSDDASGDALPSWDIDIRAVPSPGIQVSDYDLALNGLWSGGKH